VSTNPIRIPHGVPFGNPRLLARAAPKRDPACVKIVGDEEGSRMMTIRNEPPGTREG